MVDIKQPNKFSVSNNVGRNTFLTLVITRGNETELNHLLNKTFLKAYNVKNIF